MPTLDQLTSYVIDASGRRMTDVSRAAAEDLLNEKYRFLCDKYRLNLVALTWNLTEGKTVYDLADDFGVTEGSSGFKSIQSTSPSVTGSRELVPIPVDAIIELNARADAMLMLPHRQYAHPNFRTLYITPPPGPGEQLEVLIEAVVPRLENPDDEPDFLPAGFRMLPAYGAVLDASLAGVAVADRLALASRLYAEGTAELAAMRNSSETPHRRALVRAWGRGPRIHDESADVRWG